MALSPSRLSAPLDARAELLVHEAMTLALAFSLLTNALLVAAIALFARSVRLASRPENTIHAARACAPLFRGRAIAWGLDGTPTVLERGVFPIGPCTFVLAAEAARLRGETPLLGAIDLEHLEPFVRGALLEHDYTPDQRALLESTLARVDAGGVISLEEWRRRRRERTELPDLDG